MALDLQNTELGLIVARALGTPSVEILEVSAAALAAGGSQGEGGGLGIHHVTGVARTKAGLASWSMIVKALKGGSELGSDDPGSWNFWKREVLVNLTGLLEHLPAGIVAPRCYGVEERPDGECRIWMEEIQSTSSVWTMDRYTLAGRHLGQFNGAYLAGYPLPPAQPWMLSGRTRPWTMFFRPAAESSQQLADTPLARRWFGRDGS